MLRKPHSNPGDEANPKCEGEEMLELSAFAKCFHQIKLPPCVTDIYI
jgi:hypothetical protein